MENQHERERQAQLERERAIADSKIDIVEGMRTARNDENPKINSGIRDAVKEALQRVQNTKIPEPSSSFSSSSFTPGEEPIRIFISMLPDGPRLSNDSWINQLAQIFNSIIPSCLVSPFEFVLAKRKDHTNCYVWLKNESITRVLLSICERRHFYVDDHKISIKRAITIGTPSSTFPMILLPTTTKTTATISTTTSTANDWNSRYEGSLFSNVAEDLNTWKAPPQPSSDRSGQCPEASSSDVQVPVGGFRGWGQSQKAQPSVASTSTSTIASLTTRSNSRKHAIISKSRSRSPIRTSDPISIHSSVSRMYSLLSPSSSLHYY